MSSSSLSAPGSAPAPAPSSVSLSARLESTSVGIGSLLDHLSWRHDSVGDLHSDAQTIESDNAKQNTQQTNTTDQNIETNATSDNALTASTHDTTSLFSTCRPFDRSAFLAFVGTYTPLVWSHKSSPLLSPLACARRGWLCSSSPLSRDLLHCPLCRSQVAVHFTPELLSLPSSHAAITALTHKYGEQIRQHSKECPWFGTEFDERFTQILPHDMDRETAVWVAVHETRTRERSIANAIPRTLLHAFQLDESFAQTWLEQVSKSQSSPIPSLAASLPIETILAICGWEVRRAKSNTNTAPEPTSAQAVSTASSSTLQCWFGCRDVHLDQYVGSDENKSAESPEHADEEDGDVDADADADRSALQSPLKRRKLNTGVSSSSRCPSSSVAAFDPSRAHRPFCPFLQPIQADATLATDEQQQHPLGWQELLAWWLAHRPAPTSPSASATAHDTTNPSPPIDTDAIAITVDGDASTHASTEPRSQKEQQLKGIVDTVRKLLSNAVTHSGTTR